MRLDALVIGSTGVVRASIHVIATRTVQRINRNIVGKVLIRGNNIPIFSLCIILSNGGIELNAVALVAQHTLIPTNVVIRHETGRLFKAAISRDIVERGAGVLCIAGILGEVRVRQEVAVSLLLIGNRPGIGNIC